MGLLDYYRQFEDIDEGEANRLLRERREREKAMALEEVPILDLSGTEWPEFPNPDVVSASVYTGAGSTGTPTGTQRRFAVRLPNVTTSSPTRS